MVPNELKPRQLVRSHPLAEKCCWQLPTGQAEEIGQQPVHELLLLPVPLLGLSLPLCQPPGTLLPEIPGRFLVLAGHKA